MSKGYILYIEDNFDNRLLVKRVLEAEGYTVLEAGSGLQGLEVAQTAPSVDLVLVDINLPDIDGYEVTHRLRGADGLRKLPIVALTANVMEGDREKAEQAGCDGYISKPIDVDELPDQIARFIQAQASR